jgi:hypothetical protein
MTNHKNSSLWSWPKIGSKTPWPIVPSNAIKQPMPDRPKPTICQQTDRNAFKATVERPKLDPTTHKTASKNSKPDQTPIG